MSCSWQVELVRVDLVASWSRESWSGGNWSRENWSHDTESLGRTWPRCMDRNFFLCLRARESFSSALSAALLDVVLTSLYFAHSCAKRFLTLTVTLSPNHSTTSNFGWPCTLFRLMCIAQRSCNVLHTIYKGQRQYDVYDFYAALHQAWTALKHRHPTLCPLEVRPFDAPRISINMLHWFR